MKLRVLMIGPGEEALGGIATLINAFLPRLRTRVDVSYMTTAGSSRPSHRAGKLSLENLGMALSQYVRFLIHLARSRPQIIHLHTSQRLGWLKDSVFVLVGKVLGRRVVVHVHGDLLGASSSFERRYTTAVLKTADAVVAVADTWKQKLGESIPISHIHTFVNCIDTSKVRVGTSGAPNPRVVFLGRVGQEKGVFDLIDAFRHLEERGCPMTLTVAGDEAASGDLERLEIQIEEAGLSDRVHLAGPIWGDEKWDLLAEADLFVLPSYAEQLPIALLEAMAAGCAIVATRVGGIPDVIEDGYNGLLVDPADIPSLTEALETLCRDDELRQTMGQRNRTLAQERLDVVPYVDGLLEFYQELLTRSRRGKS